MRCIFVGKTSIAQAFLQMIENFDSSVISVVGTAENGAEGFQIFYRLRPQLVVTTISAGLLDGVMLTAWIKTLFPTTKVVIFAQLDEINDLQRAVHAQADALLIWPVTKKSSDETFDCKNEKHRVNSRSTTKGSQKNENLESYLRFLFSGPVDERTFCRRLASTQIELTGDLHNKSKNFIKGTDIFGEIVAYIEGNFCDSSLSVKRVAEKFYINESYLSRGFKVYTGKRMTDFIMEKRMLCAMQLLRNGYKVYRVAQAVGINNAHYFGYCFKNYTGVTAKRFLYESKREAISQNSEEN